MSEHDGNRIDERVERLEREVARLRARMVVTETHACSPPLLLNNIEWIHGSSESVDTLKVQLEESKMKCENDAFRGMLGMDCESPSAGPALRPAAESEWKFYVWCVLILLVIFIVGSVGGWWLIEWLAARK